MQNFPAMERNSTPLSFRVFVYFMTSALTYTAKTFLLQNSNDFFCSNSGKFFGYGALHSDFDSGEAD